MILLDQFPRNAFRGTPRMYDSDALARRFASQAFAARYDQQLDLELRKFLMLPYAHSEDLADQAGDDRSARRAGDIADSLEPNDP